MKNLHSVLAFVLFTLISFSAQGAGIEAPHQSNPAYLIIDGKGIHFKEWLYQEVRAPKDMQADSLNQAVTVCITVNKAGKFSYMPVGDNNPTLLSQVEKVLNKDIHCVTQKKWNSKTDSYESVDYTSYIKVHFRYMQPEVLPEYMTKEIPTKWNKKNMYTTYRGNRLQPSFQQGENLKESLLKFRKWLSTNVTYPSEDVLKGVEGDFSMSFFIDDNFRIQIIDVIESPSPLITAEVIRVIGNSPIWQPTLRWNFLTQKYDYIRSQFVLPMVFKNPVVEK